MPKKFQGENSKAVAAKARKAEKSEKEKVAKKKAEEDAYWADDDKNLAKKQAKKDEAERKKLEAAAKKKERQDLASQEEKDIQAKMSKANPVKMTQARIREEAEKREAAARAANAAKGGSSAAQQAVDTHLTKPLQENVNRIQVEGEEARTVDEAIAVLSLKDNGGESGGGGPAVDKHPEKRMKAAYEEFEKSRLPQLKKENPNMRLSQLKQMLRKEWQKHPDNPLIKQLAAMAAR
eukprot:TRINITY_DN7260_c0_g1_i3.p1 TRINITY_DN7260_c0_g1~~TRINITY_DN7260_c0_g1_i3.p1  ORF type:complete len:236 (-),score=95.82 TRINITY_DN7260_c0_g1_i3:209-916(-)